MGAMIEPLSKLIAQLSKLPGVGGKSAGRLAFHILNMSEENVRELAESIYLAKKKIRYCSVCGGITETDPCGVCTDPKRDQSTVCIVSDVRDMLAMERMGDFRGVYHVLGGCISPLKGKGPDDLRIRELLSRVQSGRIREVILATNPDVEGDATSAYIAQILKPFPVKVSRIAYGVPVGGSLEYIDEVTLSKSMTNRQEI